MSSGGRLAASVALFGLLLGTTARARAQSALEGSPPSFEPKVVHRQRGGLIAAGGVTLGLSYGAALLAGMFMTTNRNEEQCSLCAPQRAQTAPYIVVPVAGPLLQWGMEPASSRGSATWWAVWSGLQAAGAAMLVAGLIGHDVVEWRPVDAGPSFSVVPALAPQAGALSLNVRW